jgi:hypothetical protein
LHCFSGVIAFDGRSGCSERFPIFSLSRPFGVHEFLQGFVASPHDVSTDVVGQHYGAHGACFRGGIVLPEPDDGRDRHEDEYREEVKDIRIEREHWSVLRVSEDEF